MWQLVMAGAQLLSGIAEGKAQAKQLARQAALDEFEARNALETAANKASLIYEKAASVRSTQIAQIAAAGVVVGDGSAQAVVDETNKLARRDALAALYTGGRQAAALRAGARQRLNAANDAVLTGFIRGAVNAGSTLAMSGGMGGKK